MQAPTIPQPLRTQEALLRHLALRPWLSLPFSGSAGQDRIWSYSSVDPEKDSIIDIGFRIRARGKDSLAFHGCLWKVP